eukprot:5400105-Amphidinium_carterae.1
MNSIIARSQHFQWSCSDEVSEWHTMLAMRTMEHVSQELKDSTSTLRAWSPVSAVFRGEFKRPQMMANGGTRTSSAPLEVIMSCVSRPNVHIHFTTTTCNDCSAACIMP